MDEALPKHPRTAGAALREENGQARGGLVDDAPAVALAALRLFRKHWPILLVAALVAAALGLVYSKSQPRVYEATSMLEFDPDVVRPLADKTDPFRELASTWDNHEYYETQYKVMTSDRVLGAVVHDLGLQSDPAFAGKDAVAHPLPLDTATDVLRGRLHIEPVKNSRLTYIKVEDTDPKQAQKLANAVSNTYIAQNLEKTVNATGDAVVWLNSQLDHFRGELESNEDALHEFKKKNDLPSSTIEEISKQIRLEMQQYDQALTTTRTHKQELIARNSELEKVNSSNPDELPASELLSNVFLSQLRTQYQSAVRERRELVAQGKGDKHPLVLSVDQKISELSRDLVDEVKNIQGAVQHDLAILNKEEAGENNLYEDARRRAVELNLKELEFHRLDRVRAENEKVYSALLEQTKDADLARMMNVNNVRVVDTAQEPRAPIRPRVPVNVAVGALTGLLLGIGLVLLREQADSSLKSPADVEQRLGVTFLGMVPAVDGQDDGGKPAKRRNRRVTRVPGELPPELLVHERPLSSVAEAARTIRTNLMFMNPDQPYRSVLVTSAAPGEGKTTVACSLAISLAQGGQKVCIVDCDLRRPRLHRIFDRAGDAGLTNVLVGEAKVVDVALPTIVNNLSCVPSGPIPPNPGDVLHSEKFRSVLRDLLERFDRVIIDSPPLVAVTDSAILSTLVDGTVFVVRAFTTSRNTTRQGLRALSDVDAPVVGVVLNAVDMRKNDYSYYQYYHYKREGYAAVPGPYDGDDDRATTSAPPPAPPQH
jgi:succinoglycan biosynthesis transport protein ExoP